jgi:GntP family gluconate:H+ symporter
MSPVLGSQLLIYAGIAIAVLVVMIAKFRINPFIVLTTVSIGLALAAGMPAKSVVAAYEAGVGGTLGHIALVVALGAMLGKMMAESGGADRIAQTMLTVFGERNAHWAMMCVAFLCGLPLFFEVGFVLLIPIAFTVAKRANMSMIMVGLPMVAGLSVVHGLVPPHPAAMLAVHAYNADIGNTIFYAILVGIPTAMLAGPIFAKLIAPYIQLPEHNPIAAEFTERETAVKELPSFSTTIFTILAPVLLMLVGGWADFLTPTNSSANSFLRFIGTPVVALLISTTLSFWTLGFARGFGREDILKFSSTCLAPTAGITLLVGAGGGLNRILIETGVTKQIVALSAEFALSPLLLCWLLAALMRIATGSATVAMTTAAGIVGPIALAAHYPHPELLVLATGAGSLILSHVNDGGFWLVKEYFNMSVVQTLKTWTVLETIISVVAFSLTLLIAQII